MNPSEEFLTKSKCERSGIFYSRPLRKLATDEKFVGERKTTVYSNVHEDLSNAQITICSRVSEEV